jgi:hypothetical protein
VKNWKEEVIAMGDCTPHGGPAAAQEVIKYVKKLQEFYDEVYMLCDDLEETGGTLKTLGSDVMVLWNKFNSVRTRQKK